MIKYLFHKIISKFKKKPEPLTVGRKVIFARRRPLPLADKLPYDEPNPYRVYDFTFNFSWRYFMIYQFRNWGVWAD